MSIFNRMRGRGPESQAQPSLPPRPSLAPRATAQPESPPTPAAAADPGNGAEVLALPRRRPSTLPTPTVQASGRDSHEATQSTSAVEPPAETAQRIIDSLDKVPAHTAVLTANDHKSLLRLPKEVEPYLCAIELGPQRAMILYSNAGPTEVRNTLQTLRARLAAANITVARGAERLASSEVIQLVVENYTSRQGGSVEGQRSGTGHSRSKALFDSWVEYAATAGATDIHIQIHGQQATAHVRVHGELEPVKDAHKGRYTAHMAESAIAWAYNNAAGTGTNSESQFNGENAYCMISPRTIGNQQIALRYQSLRGQYGPKVVCRLLNVDLEQPTRSYEELGYAPSQCELLREAANIPSGFNLFAGITGSGKSTTLKTFIETHPGTSRSAFYSIEDPVEYPLRGVHQINLQRDLTDKAASAAKYGEVVGSLMRADIDGVLMGEIRDPATAAAGQQIVETGHMAAGTVHAHLISAIIPRLTNDEIGMSRQTLTNPNMLTLLCYQALVPVLCEHCKVPAQELTDGPEAAHLLDILDQAEARFGIGRARFYVRREGGCDCCNQRGTSGLTIVAEMLIPDRKWLRLTRGGLDYEAVAHYRSFGDGNFLSPDMTGKTVFEHALYKSALGKVDPRQCERFDTFRRFELKPEVV